MSYNVIKNVGGQYTNESGDGSIYTYMNPNGVIVVADALGTPITTQYIGSKISKDIGNLAVELGGSTVATFTSTGVTATTFTGNATSATTSTNSTVTDTNTTGTYYPTFVSGTGTQGLKVDSATGPLTYDIASGVGTLTVRDKLLVTESASGTSNSVTYETDSTGNITILQGTDGANVNIGYASKSSQGTNCVAIGRSCGQTSQGSSSVAIGVNSGRTSQGAQNVALGASCGNTNQGANSVAIGNTAGNSNQGSGAVAIGLLAGQTSQGNYSIAIGSYAGETSCGISNIIINSSSTNVSTTNTNNLILNAGSTTVTSGGNSRCYINPIRNATNQQLVQYDTTNKEVTYSDTLTLGGITYANTYGSFTATTSLQTVTLLKNDNYIFSTISNALAVTAQLPSGSTNGQKYRVKLVYQGATNKPPVRIICQNGSELMISVSGGTLSSTTFYLSSANNFIEFVYFDGAFYATTTI